MAEWIIVFMSLYPIAMQWGPTLSYILILSFQLLFFSCRLSHGSSDYPLDKNGHEVDSSAGTVSFEYTTKVLETFVENT